MGSRSTDVEGEVGDDELADRALAQTPTLLVLSA
jgi:hypothetical protein